MTGIIERISIYFRERRFRRSLRPGFLSRMLRIPHHAATHGARGADAAVASAAIEDVVDAWGMSTVGERHKLVSRRAGRVLALLEKCRFGAAEKGYSNVLQRFAAKVKTVLADTESLLREARAQFAAAAQELVRHCAEIAAPVSMTYHERIDGLWKAFAAALSLEALAGAVSTAGELGWPLSMILAGVLGAIVFLLGCGAGWARQHSWVAPRTGWALVVINFALVTIVLLAFCYYRLTLADLAATTTGMLEPTAAATAATIPPLVLLLAIGGWAAWFWTMHIWLSIYGVAPGVRIRAIRKKRAIEKCRQTVDDGRRSILNDAAVADSEIDRACAAAALRRSDATVRGMEVCTEAALYERDRESIFAAWGAAHSEFAGIVTQVANVRREPRELPAEFPVIPTDHVPGTITEIQGDADALMIDEGRAKLAIAATCVAGLRDLDRLKETLPNLSPGKELLS
jgi:hypothetical protein